ncbi:MAG TPA: tRNA (adenosine(37)-N6)-dimethylallyltransferase MiaA [Actinomycetes bacterium]|nr:tRNA (adenosine(37)-N6)-dimethylallyltransferase MiaA [Actinomycetes bacterium]
MTSLVAIVGPTASGKSELAISLAMAVGGEIINADSMQLYEGMNIGTAKLTDVEQRGIRHHLLSVWPVTKTATLAEFQQLALEVVTDVQSRGAVPILVGGSGMYVQSVVDRWTIPGTDPAIREALNAELERVGPKALYERLLLLDPSAASAILPTNGRRIVRALEVINLQGTFKAELPRELDTAGRVLIGMQIPRADMDDRISLRVDRMWSGGLTAEVEGLVAKGLREGVTARQALGYAQVLSWLDGEISEKQAMERTVQATKRFARRQESWFRRDPRVAWLPYDSSDLVDLAVSAVAATRR